MHKGDVFTAATRRSDRAAMQSKIQPITGSAPSVSQEGVREHTYEFLQDYTINMGGWSKRVRICQRYHEGFSLITRSVITAGSDLLAAKPVPNRAMLRGMSTRRRSYSSAIQLAEVRH